MTRNIINAIAAFAAVSSAHALASCDASLNWRRDTYETHPPTLVAAGMPTNAPVPGLAKGFNGRVAPLERIDAKNALGIDKGKIWRASAWRNERVNGQFVVWSDEDVRQMRLETCDMVAYDGSRIPSSAIKARFVRYVLAGFTMKGETINPPVPVGDILDDAERIDLPAKGFRPVWLTVSVPQDAAPGTYVGRLTVRAAGRKRIDFTLSLNVLPRTLPAPKDWKFFLDLWQHPWAVARYHGVKPFSKEHYALMRPLWRELADAGQKAITATITDLPWNHQNFDPYWTMVKHVKCADGTWRHDYSLFDEYVEFCKSCGLGPQIHCYTMATWGHIVYWTDESTGDTVSAKLVPGTPEHEEFWGAFLRDFRIHLSAKRWLGDVFVALDERKREELEATAKLIAKCAPELRLEMAGNKKPSEFKGITVDNYCQYIKHITPDYLKEVRETRSGGRFTSTFYVCCVPERPNSFVTSPLHEQVWLGLYAAAAHLDGFLRWAYVNWPRDPMFDTSFGDWRPGDTFFVYPGCRAAVRWETLRDGIEEAEKIRILREEGAATPELEKALGAIAAERGINQAEKDCRADVEAVLRAVERASAK